MGTAQRSHAVNPRLAEACRKIYRGWIPISGEALEHIRSGLEQGVYDLDIDFFTNDLKSDFGLFAYCLRESPRFLDQNERKVFNHPRELFQAVGVENLKKLLNVAEKEISCFSLRDCQTPQAARFQELAISASTSELLAETKNIDPIMGYTSTCLRQLGVTLIAWNYPEVYAEAVERAKAGEDVNAVLTISLGFAPSLLGIALVRQWNLGPGIRSTLGDRRALDSLQRGEDHEALQTANTLAKICEVGETLARASNPKQYPSAQEDWSRVKSRIQLALGEDGMKLIRNRVKENCLYYMNIAPEIFRPALEEDPEERQHVERIGKLSDRNRYVRYCAPDTHQLFRSIYEKLDKNPDDRRDIVSQLIKEVVPQVGFARGCIYLLETESMSLTPRLKIGKEPLSLYRNYHALSVSLQRTNPVTAAYHCNAPIVESHFALTHLSEASIASVLGQRERVGVLYLEPLNELLESGNSNLLQRFKAVLLCLQEVLGIA